MCKGSGLDLPGVVRFRAMLQKATCFRCFAVFFAVPLNLRMEVQWVSIYEFPASLVRCGIGAEQPEPVFIALSKQCVDRHVIQHIADVKDVTATCRFL